MHHNRAASVSHVRVRYAETDQMGVAYHANHLMWFEVGRTDWLRHRGWTYRDMEGGGFRLPVIEAHCRYRGPARYDDELEIHTNASLDSPARIRFDYEVRLAGSPEVVSVGHTVHAVLGANGRPCRIPERVRRLLPSDGVGAKPDGRRHRLQ
jgi:acyl-CoA thioester hydrolase